MLALCRRLQQKAVMIDLVNELQVEGVDVDAPLTEWKGVTMGAEKVVKINFSRRCKGGAYVTSAGVVRRRIRGEGAR